jgi:hypothetical protein
MAGTTAEGVLPRVIVIPRPLESHFYERLSKRYAGRDDVVVVVDRRVGERRHARWVTGPGPFTERRRGDRRGQVGTWSLPDMPFSAS